MPPAAEGVEIVAHRGASAYAPEHTLAAYDLAVRQRADMIELDVRASADGVPFVLHDATLLRTTGDHRAIASMTGQELDGLRSARRPLRLEDVLARYRAEVRWLIEVKDAHPGWERAMLATIERCGLQDRVVVQAFDVNALLRLHVAAPWLALAPLFDHPPWQAREFDAVAGFAGAIGVRHGRIDAALTARAHARGLKVLAWTVNDHGDMLRVGAAGVDGVITDRPDVARAARDVGAPAA